MSDHYSQMGRSTAQSMVVENDPETNLNHTLLLMFDVHCDMLYVGSKKIGRFRSAA
jgi:hypothetical protein